MKRSCPYCNQWDVKFSREHIISRSVLHAVFGTPVRNTISGELIGKRIQDQEPVSKHVCRDCNSKLSPYDAAAVDFVREIFHKPNLVGSTIKITPERLGWLLKTHLNYLAITKSRRTGLKYPINDRIFLALISGNAIPNNHLTFLVEAIEADESQWDPSNETWISCFYYRSVEFLSQRTLVSNFRLKSLETYFVFPSDDDHFLFSGRVRSTLDEMAEKVGIDPQLVDMSTLSLSPNVEIRSYLPRGKLDLLLTSERENWSRIV